MEFCPIVPIQYLHTLAKLSHHQMVLAHWLVDKRYFDFYKKMRDRGDFIILDNGCCELGKSIPFEELIDWSIKLGGVNIIVVPDTEHEDNVKLAVDFFKYLEKWFESLGEQEFLKYRGTEFMVVPHTEEELRGFLNLTDWRHYIKYIGLNRGMEEDYGRARIIRDYNSPGIKYHLLGFHRNPIAEIESVRKYSNRILGVDSSVPYSIASRGRVIGEYRPYPKHLDLNDVPGLDRELLKHCKKELAWFIDWVREEDNV